MTSRPPGTRAAPGTAAFSALAITLGVCAGLGAWVLRFLIGLFHDVLFQGHLGASYDANVHSAPSAWGPAVLLVPPLAALGVVFLVNRFAPEAKGHGVPEVIDAVYYERGVIRPIVAAIKSVASALSIGSGGSVGREGPIIQIGAAVGSTMGRRLGLERWQLVTLVAAGGGAGIAATFNTPIGGVLFAVEVLMQEISIRTLVPVALATATATVVGRLVFGDHPSFAIPALEAATTGVAYLPAYLGLGVLAGGVAAAFIKGLYALEDRFTAWFRNDYLRHVVGMLVVGGILVVLMAGWGHYYVEGVGYATIRDVLAGHLASIAMLLVLLALKLLVTTLTLGSGASGGIFSPSLFMGATLGAAYGIALNALLPGLHLDPVTLALAGMAGVVAGATGAALTAIVMIFEMTLDYSVVLPMTLTVAVAHGLRPLLVRESIYTMKLTRRGHVVPRALRATSALGLRCGDLALVPATLLPASALRAELPVVPGAPYVVLLGEDGITGVLDHPLPTGPPGPAAEPGRDDALRLGDLPGRPFVTLDAAASPADALLAMERAHADVAVVREDETHVRGILPEHVLVDAVAHHLDLLEG